MFIFYFVFAILNDIEDQFCLSGIEGLDLNVFEISCCYMQMT